MIIVEDVAIRYNYLQTPIWMNIKEGLEMHRRGTALLLCFLLGIMPFVTGATTSQRAAFTTRYALELEGSAVGWLNSVSGGTPYADVTQDHESSDPYLRKHLAGVKYEDITITTGADMSAAFYDWLKDALDGKAQRKNGAIVAVDYNGHVTQRLAFTDAVVTEVDLPALDASSKDAAKLTVKITPETTRRASVKNETVIVPTTSQKQWLASNFRLSIDGLDNATSRVNKIEAIVVKQKMIKDQNHSHEAISEVGPIDASNLTFTLPDSDAGAIYDWVDDFIVQGDNSSDAEKDGTLEFLAPDMKTVLFQFKLGHLGIFRLSAGEAETSSNAIRQATASMYVEEITLSQAPTK